MTKREFFIDKYGLDPKEIVDEAVLLNIDNKDVVEDPERAMGSYFAQKGIDISATRYNEYFWTYLIEACQEAGVKWPKGWRTILMDTIPIVDVTPINPSVPSKKPVMETFKDIVGDDDERESLKGVYVNNGDLVGSDANKMLVLKNNEYKQYNGKIINLDIYLKSKGRKIDFIDGKFPDYKAVFPKQKTLLAKDMPLYNLFNLTKSCCELLKYLPKYQNFPINFKFSNIDDIVAVNPVLLFETINAAMQNGFTTCDWYCSEGFSYRIFIFEFGRGNQALCMPIKTFEVGTPPISLERILNEFGGSQKNIAAKTIIPKPSPIKAIAAKVAAKKSEVPKKAVTSKATSPKPPAPKPFMPKPAKTTKPKKPDLSRLANITLDDI